MSILHENKTDLITTRDIDMKGRRTIGASRSKDPNDYVIKQELTDAIKQLTPPPDTIITKNGKTVPATQTNAVAKGLRRSVDQFANGNTIWDGATDATDAFRRAILFLFLNGGGTLFIDAGTYLISGSLPIFTNIRLQGEKTSTTVLLVSGNFSGSALFIPLASLFDAEFNDFRVINQHDQSLYFVVAQSGATDYVRINHHRLSLTGINGWTLTPLGGGFIGATRNCVWEDVNLNSQDYTQSPYWLVGTSYAYGATVNFGVPAKPYMSLAAGNIGFQPDTHPIQWQLLENSYTDVGWQVFQGDLNVWRRCQVYGTGRGIHTTILSNISSGSQTVTPANISNIQVGSVLSVMNADGTNYEKVTVTGQSGAGFTATFASSKTGPGIRVDGQIDIVVSTTVASNISNSPSQVVTPASMSGILNNRLYLISNSDGSNSEIIRITGVTGSTFTVSLQNGAKTGPGIIVTGPYQDPFVEIHAGSENQFYDLEVSPHGLNKNKPRFMAYSEANLEINGYFNEETKVPSTVDSELGIYLFECLNFQLIGQIRPDPYRRITVVRSNGSIESLSPGSFGGVNDYLDQFIILDDSTSLKSSVLLKQLYVERNNEVRLLTWADKGLIIDRVTCAFDVLGHNQELSLPAVNRFEEYTPQNLFQNPSFEAGFYGYTNNDGTATNAIIQSEVNLGLMLHVSGYAASGGGKLVYQSLQIVVPSQLINRPFTFSCWVKMTATLANPATSQTYVRPYLSNVLGSPSPTITIHANKGWVRLVQTFVPLQSGNMFVGLNLNLDAADSAWELFTDDWCCCIGSVGGIDSARFGSFTLLGQTIFYTTNGNPPASGTFQVGDICLDATGVVPGWRCSVAGSPGTWLDFLTGKQVTLQNAHGSASSVVWQVTSGVAAPTDVSYTMTKSSNNTDWTFYSYDGTTFRTVLEMFFNAGSPHFVFNRTTDDGINVFQFQGDTKITGNLTVTGTMPGAPPTGTAGGDLTGTYPNPTLKATGTAGTYTKVTFDSKGRETAGTTLASGDIPDLSGIYDKFKASYSETGRTTALTAVNLRSGGVVLPVGTYACSVYCSVHPSGAATITPIFSGTDERSFAFAMGTAAFTGAADGNTQGIIIVRLDGVHDLTISTTQTGTATYDIYAVVTLIGA